MKTERNEPTKDAKNEPYDVPIHSVPRGRFVPVAGCDGSYKAAVLSNGEGGR